MLILIVCNTFVNDIFTWQLVEDKVKTVKSQIRNIFYLNMGSSIYIATEDTKNNRLRAISSIKINNGDCKNWTYQGLSYKNDTIYVPVWNEKNQKPIQF